MQRELELLRQDSAACALRFLADRQRPAAHYPKSCRNSLNSVISVANPYRVAYSGITKDILLRFKNIDARLPSLIQRMDRLDDAAAERRFRGRAASCFGHLLRRIRVVDNSALADRIDDAIESGTFAEADREPLLLLDVVAWGRDVQTREERYLAAEVSAGIGETDILRAADRAALLEKLTGVPVLPVVAGYSISPRFRSIAAGRQVQVVIVEEPR